MIKNSKKILSLFLSLIMIMSMFTGLDVLSVAEDDIEEPEVLIGDVNFDGKITVDDARITLDMSAGIEPITKEKFLAGNIDGNGSINAFDARIIFQIAFNLEDKYYDGGTPKISMESELMGEVGSEHLITVSAKDFSGTVSADLIFLFDSSIFEFIDISCNNEDITMFAGDLINDGEISCSFIFEKYAERDGEICTIKFKVLKKVDTSVTFNIYSWYGSYDCPRESIIKITTQEPSTVPPTTEPSTVPQTEMPTYLPTTKPSVTEAPSTVRPTESTTAVLPATDGPLGDVDGDSFITAADARIILRIAAKLEYNVDNSTLRTSDLNEDGIITVADARLALSYSTLLETTPENVAPARTYLDEERYEDVKLKALFSDESEGKIKVVVLADDMIGTEAGNLFFSYDPEVLEYVNITGISVYDSLDLFAGDNYEYGKISFAFVEKKQSVADILLAEIEFNILKSEATQIEYTVGTWSGTRAPKDGSLSIAITEEPTTRNESEKMPEEEIPEGDPTLYFDIPESVVAGNTFNLVLKGSNLHGLENADLEFTYDTEYLEYLSISQGDDSHYVISNGDMTIPGNVLWSFITEKVAARFDLVIISFKALKTGSTDISVNLTSWNGTEYPCIENGIIQISSNPETEPTTEEPATEPTTEESSTEEPTTKEPETDAPSTESTTKEPVTDVPTTEKPPVRPSERPSTDGPAIDGPATDGPDEKPVSDKLEVSNKNITVDEKAKTVTFGQKNTAEDISKAVKNDKSAIFGKDGKELRKSDLVGTGSEIRIMDNSGKILSRYTVCVPTDVDGNGKTTAADARLALRGSAKLEKIEGVYAQASDVTGDGKITAADARKILRISAGLEKA